jgi:dTDP-4-dehydrorhamnose 3,5-epimerase
MSISLGEHNPTAIIVPKGIVHGYRNIGDVDGMVINCPNRLYMGLNRSEPVDEIRHEDDPDTIYRMD